jgi:hypothetical protein
MCPGRCGRVVARESSCRALINFRFPDSNFLTQSRFGPIGSWARDAVASPVAAFWLSRAISASGPPGRRGWRATDVGDRPKRANQIRSPPPVSGWRRLSRRVPDLATRVAAPVRGRRRRIPRCRDASRFTKGTTCNSRGSARSSIRGGGSLPVSKAHGNLQGLDEGCPGRRGRARSQESVIWTVRARRGAGQGYSRPRVAHDSAPCGDLAACRPMLQYDRHVGSRRVCSACVCALHASRIASPPLQPFRGSCDENLRR